MIKLRFNLSRNNFHGQITLVRKFLLFLSVGSIASYMLKYLATLHGRVNSENQARGIIVILL